MPNFTHEGSHEFWSNYKDPMVYRVVTYMESVEDWTLDGYEELEEAINRLGSAMEGISNVDLDEKDRFIELIAYLKTSRTLRILQALDAAHPGTASKMLMYAEEQSHSSEAADLFLKRNIAFERMRLLGRVFRPERLALVQAALENEQPS